jgi:hypothetical protein
MAKLKAFNFNKHTKIATGRNALALLCSQRYRSPKPSKIIAALFR